MCFPPRSWGKGMRLLRCARKDEQGCGKSNGIDSRFPPEADRNVRPTREIRKPTDPRSWSRTGTGSPQEYDGCGGEM